MFFKRKFTKGIRGNTILFFKANNNKKLSYIQELKNEVTQQQNKLITQIVNDFRTICLLIRMSTFEYHNVHTFFVFQFVDM